MKVDQDIQDIHNHLKEQIQFILNSCDAFDNGFKGEAKRLAATIRVLVHDTPNSISLLTQLRCKDSLYYHNTSLPYVADNLVAHLGLIGVKAGVTGVEYYAFLGDGFPDSYLKPWVTFPTWWTNTIIIDDKMNKFNRKDLILTVANQDGGTHVDPKLNQAYAELSRNNSLNMFQVTDSHETPISDPHLVSIRQIAYEIIETLKRKFPELF
ncbi:hypothetical protein [Paenibacillus oleatilyticus]|uniref:Esterase n=1 Tax=Paenibacillus oleatilyticus TaxID=2594886 RepID=A0ABV4V6S0_9BACL